MTGVPGSRLAALNSARYKKRRSRMSVVELGTRSPIGPGQVGKRDGVVGGLENEQSSGHVLFDCDDAALKSELEATREDKSISVCGIICPRQRPGKLFSAAIDLKERPFHRADEDRGRAFFTRTIEACAEYDAGNRAFCRSRCIAEGCGLATAAGCQLVGLLRSGDVHRHLGHLYAGRQYRTVLLNPDGWR